MPEYTVRIIDASENVLDSRWLPVGQLSQAIDLPGYSHAVNLGPKYIGGDLRRELPMRLVHCVGTSKAAIESAMRKWPNYRPGTNRIQRIYKSE